MQIEFWKSSNAKNKIYQQIDLKERMKKMGSFVWSSCLLPELRSLNCQKMAHFLYILQNPVFLKAEILLTVAQNPIILSIFWKI